MVFLCLLLGAMVRSDRVRSIAGHPCGSAINSRNPGSWDWVDSVYPPLGIPPKKKE